MKGPATIEAPGTTLAIGSTFAGAYEIAGELGIGSFGRVYRARQLSTNRDVAIKVLRIRDDDSPDDLATQTERFRREMQLSSELSHPNIVRLIDSGEVDGGQLYAVFELVPGRTLRDTLAEDGALSLPETIHLMTQVLDALACAHGRGVVHRDLKPENIMIVRTGARRNALILDFGLGGLAREAEGVRLPRLTAAHEFLGTPCYAAPEQLRGESPSIRSELYSWGLIFLECLTGELAISGASGQDVVMRQLGPEPVPIPPWLRKHRLGRLLETVTSKSVERRNLSIEEMLEMLDEVSAATVPTGRAILPEGHRRQLSVVSCRLSVSNPRGGELDVEEADTLIQERRAAIAEIAEELGGRVAATMADRLLLVFGYPQAREHDSRLAARAALRIVTEANESPHGKPTPRLEACAGVHTGLAIVRDRVESGLDAHYDVTGPTPELATRLEELARPGEVLVSPDVQRLLRGRIRAEPLRDRTIGRSDEPETVFRLSGDEGPHLSAETARGGRETRLVGRSQQVDLLNGRWQDAERGRPTAVLITGEPGIGKSRLVREFRRTVPPSSWVECRCVPESQNSPLRPFIDALTMMSGSIQSLLVRAGLDVGETLPLFLSLLGLPPDPRHPAPPHTPERRKDLTFHAIVTLLLRLAAERPRVFVVGDLHWADPTSLELVEQLVREVRASHSSGDDEVGLCVILTSRPTFMPNWALENAQVVPLARLERDEVEAMVVAGMTDRSSVPRPLLDRVVQHADGVPLFVEEVTWMLLESNVLTEHADTLGGDQGFDIPVTLWDLLASRLDVLSPDAKETVQIAAAFGREFRFEMLAAASPRHDALLRGDLRELVDAGLVYHRPRVQPESYLFKHALVRDAAYEMMTRPARQDVHGHIADTLLRYFPEVARDRPEVLAQHFEGGGRAREAVDYWKRSGDHTMARGAYTESIRHFERGLSLLPTVTDEPGKAQLELGILESLGTAKLATQGYASPDVEETFGRAQRLCDQVGEEVPVRVLHGIWGVMIMRGDRDATAEFLPRFHRHADRTRNPVSLITAHGHTGLRAFFTGDFPLALSEMTTATQWYESPEYRAFLRDYGYDGGLYPFAYRTLSLWILGRSHQARVACDELLALAMASANPYGLAIAQSFSVLLAILCGETAAALEGASRLSAHVNEQKLYFFLCPAMCAQGWAAVHEERPDDGIQLIQQGLGIFQMIGVRAFYPYYLSFLAEAHLARRAVDEGIATVDEALTLCRTTVDCFYEAELRRLQAELLRLGNRRAEAKASFEAALELARRQGALSFELRAATGLARLLHDGGQDAAAQLLLRGVYERFTEGFDSRDLALARSSLVEQRAS